MQSAPTLLCCHTALYWFEMCYTNKNKTKKRTNILLLHECLCGSAIFCMCVSLEIKIFNSNTASLLQPNKTFYLLKYNNWSGWVFFLFYKTREKWRWVWGIKKKLACKHICSCSYAAVMMEQQRTVSLFNITVSQKVLNPCLEIISWFISWHFTNNTCKLYQCPMV